MMKAFRLFSLLLIFLATAPLVMAETMMPLVVPAGSSLIRLANSYCHDREDWRRIAEINKLRPPYIIRKDTTLLVPAELLLGESVSATVGAVHGEARLSPADLSPPRPVVAGDSVPPGAAIETGKDSYVLLVFPDQRFVQINAASRLRIDFALRLADGSVRIETTLERGESLQDIKPHSRPNDSSTSRTPTALIGVRGTTYRLKVNGAESTQVETLHGEVDATAQGVRRVVPYGQGVVVHKKQPPSPPCPLPPSPDGFTVEKVYTSQPLCFQLPENPSGGLLRLTISRDGQGLQAVAERTGKAKEVLAVTLPTDGPYFLSLTAADKAGFESLPTPPRAFLVRVSPSAPILAIPQNAHFFTPSASLSWSEIGGATGYRVMVAQDAGFAKPLSEAKVAAPPWDTPNLPLGRYYARVQSIAADGFQSAWSQPAAFTIAEPPRLLDSQAAAGAPIALRWSATQEGGTYDLQMAAEPGFSDILVAAEGLPHPEYVLKDPLKPGAYYLRLRGNPPDSPQSPWGPAHKITIQPAPMTIADKVIMGVLVLCSIL